MFGLSFVAGVVSFLSPCVMPLMPAYLSLISGVSIEEIQSGHDGGALRRKVLTSCLSFVLGFSFVFIMLGASATAIGYVLRSWSFEIGGFQLGIAQLAGLVILVMGLHIMGVLKLMPLYQEKRFQVEVKQRGWVRTFVVGAAFAFGWSPCVGPILGSVLTMAGSRQTLGMGMALLAVYSLGLAIPFLITGWSVEIFFRVFQKMRHHFHALEIFSGGVLAVVGLLVMTGQFTRINAYFGFLNELVSTIEGWFL